MSYRWAFVAVFLAGIAVGVVATLFGPRWADPYLPQAMRGATALIEGEVVRKLREADRLLFTVLTPEGAVLATFKERVTEIEQLVDEGDRITLALARYAPFVEDPKIARVTKPRPATAEDKQAPAPAPPGPAAPAAPGSAPVAPGPAPVAPGQAPPAPLSRP
ncbi:MAG TPA: hypothetical protein VFR64_17845 [Methylomirabilota bacterium]|nr:hypothetical protein [Methylomirabilota bacterium]